MDYGQWSERFVALSPGVGVAFQRRTSAGGDTTRTASGSGDAPAWVRLVRKGSTFTAYRSTDGRSWTTIETTTISMPGQDVRWPGGDEPRPGAVGTGNLHEPPDWCGIADAVEESRCRKSRAGRHRSVLCTGNVLGDGSR